MNCAWRATYLWFWSERVIALFLSVLNRGIAAGRMVPPALFNIEHNLAPSVLPSLPELVSGI
jgi:hypothetical protein